MKRIRLIAARKKQKMTQKQVALAIGLKTRQAYSHIELGRRGTSVEKWDAVEDLFGIDQRILRK